MITCRDVWSVLSPLFRKHFIAADSGTLPMFHGISAALSISHCYSTFTNIK